MATPFSGPVPPGTTVPAKPADQENGSFAPVVHDRAVVQTVLAITLPKDEHLTATITAGDPLFKVTGITASDLVLEQEDPSTLPAGTKGPVLFWDLQNPVPSDGTKPLHAKHGQRISVAVTLDVPIGSIPPGEFAGTLLLHGGSFSKTVSLQGTYLAVDPTSLIGQKWQSMGAESRFGDVLSNVHLADDRRGTVQEFQNGALYDTANPGIYRNFSARDLASASVARLASSAPSSPSSSAPSSALSSSADVSAERGVLPLQPPSNLHASTAPPPTVRRGESSFNAAKARAVTPLYDYFVFYFSNAVYAKWKSLATMKDGRGVGVWNSLGLPTEDTFRTVEGGEALRFQGGAIVVRENQAVEFTRALKTQREATFSAVQPERAVETPSRLAPSRLNATPAIESALSQYAVPRIVHAAAFVVYGSIYAHYAQLGDLSDPARQPFLGLPTSDELPAGRGRVSHFDGADIYWATNVGAHEVHGAIRQHWRDLGGFSGFLGFPLTDESGTPDGVGRYNRFEGGVIYWTPGTGAYEVHGAILDLWSSLGFEKSFLGYPVSDETGGTLPPPLYLSARVSYFQFGQIVWSDATGAVDIPDSFATSQQVLTPAGTALGGSVTLTLSSNGDYSFQFHMHDSGIPDYDFQVHGIFTTSTGLNLAISHSGHVEGTASTLPWHAPNRDDDHTESGNSSWVQIHWADIKKDGKLWVTKDYSATGVIGFIDDLAKGILDIAAGATGGALGIVIGLGSEIGQVFGNLGIGGAFGLIAGTVVFAFGGGIALAVVAGIGAGLVTNALIEQRQIYQTEYDLANNAVFLGTLPPVEHIYLTNLSGLGGKAFTIPGADGNIYINLGEAYGDPINYLADPAYQTPGELLVHELTHAWQIKHSSFLPGLTCQGFVTGADRVFGENPYVYGPPGPSWGDFQLEQQGAIVDQWFAGRTSVNVPYRKAHDINDPYFRYISENIRKGVT